LPQLLIRRGNLAAILKKAAEGQNARWPYTRKKDVFNGERAGRQRGH
jgi:hypothetical protein